MTNQESSYYKKLFDKYFDALLIINMNNETIIDANRSVEKVLGYKLDELIGTKFSALFPEKSEMRNKSDLFNSLNDGIFVQDFLNAKGDIIYLEMTLTIIQQDSMDTLLISLRNLSKLVRVEKQLRQTLKIVKELSRKDTLTDLHNRRSLINIINNETYRFERNHIPFVIMIADIDHYKYINDEYGHDTGDFVLKEIACLLSQTIRKQDVVGRWGGDEFLFLLPETDIEGAKSLSESLRDKIASTVFQYNDKKFQLSMTFGFAVFRAEETIETCLKKADNALYQGKKSGRNKCIAARGNN